MAPSFEAREAHRCLKNRPGIFRARDKGLLDHPYVPRHPSSSPPTEEHQMGLLTNYYHQMKSCGQSILCISLLLYWVSYVINECIINGCSRKVFMSFTDQVMSGIGIWFFIMSIWSDGVASQSVIRWCRVSLACKQSLHVGSISALILDWK